MIRCKKYGSEKYVRNGKARVYQKYLCKEHGCSFIEGDRRTNKKIKARKAICIMLYGQEECQQILKQQKFLICAGHYYIDGLMRQ